MIRKRIISALLTVAVIVSLLPVYAMTTVEGIGQLSRLNSITIGQDTKLSSSTLYHSSAGKVEERYIEYTPNDVIQPVVAYGTKLYGLSTGKYVANFLEDNGKYVVAGVNGDFFQTTSGIPIGMVITDGIIRSSHVDLSNVNAVGFMEDGSAIIGQPKMDISLKTSGGQTVSIGYINKSRHNYSVYLLTPDYAATTKTTLEGTSIILTDIEGALTVGGTVTGTVGSIIKGKGEVPINEGTMVLTATTDNNCDAAFIGIEEGMDVTITVSVADERWKDVAYAVGSGVKLVENGSVLSGLDNTKAPRTALGVRADGSIVFYTVDGRQAGYSAGLSLTSVAERMVSLGCVEAVNLDGGGSTASFAKYPGYDTGLEVINSPSDGRLRNCANYIFLINTAEMGENTEHLHLYPYDSIMLAGSSQIFEVKATDKNYYPVSVPGDIEFDTPYGYGEFSDGGTLIAGYEEGVFDVEARSADAVGTAQVRVVTSPTAIALVNEETNSSVTTLTVKPGTSLSLGAICYYDGVQMTSSDELLTWSVSEGLGTIDEQGNYIATEVNGRRGTITVTAGNTSVTVAVTISGEDNVPPSVTNLTATITADGMLEIKAIAKDTNSDLSPDNITVKLDGIGVVFSYSAETGEIIATMQNPADGRLHRITVTAKDIGENITRSSTELDLTGDSTETIFVDISGHWSEKYANYLNDRGVVNGTVRENGTFADPDESMTRAQFAVMMANYMGLDTDQYANVVLSYQDNDKLPAWGRNAIAAMYANNIINGKLIQGKLYYDPDAPITRAEIVTVLGRYLGKGYTEAEMNFNDVADIPEYAKEYMGIFVNLNIISGYSDGSVKPNRAVTRGESFKLIMMMY